MQEVFEKILRTLEEKRDEAEKNMELSDMLSEITAYGGMFHAFDKAIEIVKQEAELYDNGWIPCSVVDHPEHCNDCEVTMLDTHGYTRDIAFYTDKWRRSSDEAAVTVIAWKEPSQPYQPKGE